jgi:peptidoglycan/LPS O-acetylase OafA/YrhL
MASRQPAGSGPVTGGHCRGLDALRGVAASAVFLMHAGVRVSPGFRSAMVGWIDLGAFGVMLFFLCSGYVIPASLERHGSLGRFWVKRAFRLLPLYWLSLIGALACYATGAARGEGVLGAFAVLGSDPAHAALARRPAATVLAHVAMAQDFLGVPRLIELYWTLGLELVFYAVVSVLFAGGALGRSVPVAVRFLVATMAVQVVSVALGVPVRTGHMAALSLMLVGAVLCRVNRGQVSRRSGAGVVALAAATLAVSAFGEALVFSEPWRPVNLLNGQLAALLLFVGTLWLGSRARAWRSPKPLVFLGEVSYSLYLIHPLVLVVVPPLATSVLSVLTWSAALLSLATLTYYCVEIPFMTLGRRLAGVAVRS